jgi:hypothetical protein
MAIGDGQRIGTELGVSLPGAVRRPGEHAVTDHADVDRHHLADKTSLDHLLHVHQRRVDASL